MHFKLYSDIKHCTNICSYSSTLNNLQCKESFPAIIEYENMNLEVEIEGWSSYLVDWLLILQGIKNGALVMVEMQNLGFKENFSFYLTLFAFSVSVWADGKWMPK